MPRQNRVTPFGDLVAVEARGAWMGNRGRLHDDHQHIRRWADGRRWIICVLDFKGRHRPVMAPGRYTELFFLDEATALAAGHRPCAECRRTDFDRFRAAWAEGTGQRSSAESMDRALDDERRLGDRRRTVRRSAVDLPDGAMVDLAGEAHLVWDGRALRWSPSGYTGARTLPADAVPVLTPQSTLAVLAAGYRPQVDASA